MLDKFVTGMQAGPEREKLYAMNVNELTLAKAVDLAESVRCARAGAAATPAVVSPGPSRDTGEPVYKMERSRVKPSSKSEKCQVCGRKNHKKSECRFINYTCKKCNKKGHLYKMCNKINFMLQSEVSEGDDDGKLNNIRCINGEAMMETVSIHGHRIKFEIDSGSAVTAISDKMYRENFKFLPLLPCSKRLSNYTGGRILCLGNVQLPFLYSGRTKKLDVCGTLQDLLLKYKDV